MCEGFIQLFDSFGMTLETFEDEYLFKLEENVMTQPIILCFSTPFFDLKLLVDLFGIL